MVELKNFSLPSAKSDEYLPQIGIWTRLGGFLLVGVVAMAVISVISYQLSVISYQHLCLKSEA